MKQPQPTTLRQPEQPGGLPELVEVLAQIVADLCVDGQPNAVLPSSPAQPEQKKRAA